MSVRVKICGLTRRSDAVSAISAGADMVGLVFWAGSRRAVDLAQASAIVAGLASHVWRVGVFVNSTRDEIQRIRAALDLTAIQLHGDEPPELLDGWPCPVIRAVRLREPDDAERALSRYRPDYFLCEGASGDAYGGAGARFDWEWARAFPAERLIVAGGLHPGNVAAAVHALRPFGIDVATGVESAPGVKDESRVVELINNAKAA
jgi:phosphoribosylanthranilate isomerase